jgi:hypothetical protein
MRCSGVEGVPLGGRGLYSHGDAVHYTWVVSRLGVAHRRYQSPLLHLFPAAPVICNSTLGPSLWSPTSNSPTEARVRFGCLSTVLFTLLTMLLSPDCNDFFSVHFFPSLITSWPFTLVAPAHLCSLCLRVCKGGGLFDMNEGGAVMGSGKGSGLSLYGMHVP